MRSTTARPGTAGGRTEIRESCNTSLLKIADTQTRLHAFAQKHRIIGFVKAALRTCADTGIRIYANLYNRKSVNQVNMQKGLRTSADL
jgi:hypothetical protein